MSTVDIFRAKRDRSAGYRLAQVHSKDAELIAKALMLVFPDDDIDLNPGYTGKYHSLAAWSERDDREGYPHEWNVPEDEEPEHYVF